MKSSSIYSILRFTAVSFRAQLYDKEEKRCAGTWVQAGPWIVEIVRIVANVHEKQWIQRTGFFQKNKNTCSSVNHFIVHLDFVASFVQQREGRSGY